MSVHVLLVFPNLTKRLLNKKRENVHLYNAGKNLIPQTYLLHMNLHIKVMTTGFET